MKRLLLAGLLVFGLSVSAQAATTMVSGLGGISGYGENQLADNDDLSTSFLDLTSVFSGGLNFYGTTYSGLYLNNNGNVTFNSAAYAYISESIVGPTGNPMIAPFFSDVDTRGAGDVFWDLDTVNGVFSATWDAVGSYNSNVSPLNSFQLRLTDQGSGDFDIEFRYQTIGWTIGDVIGGTQARAGYNSGNGVDHAEVSASGTSEAMMNLVNTSNVGVAGLYQWQVRNGSVGSGSPASVPEPSTLVLLGLGIVGLGFAIRRFKKR